MPSAYQKVLAASCVAFLTFSCRALSWFWRDEQPTVTPLGAWQPGMTLRQTFETFPKSGGEETVLRLLRDNGESWVARWQLLASGKQSIDLSYFILHQDVFGIAFLGHLLDRARSGVKMRILLDAQGTRMSWTPIGNDYMDELAENENVEIKVFRPLLSRYLEAFFKMTPTAAVASEHDKIIVVDGRLSLIGGRNIGVEYFAHMREEGAFEDTDLWIESAKVSGVLTEAFDAQYESPQSAPQKEHVANLQPLEDELLGTFRAMDAWLRGRTPDPKAPWIDEIRKHEHLRGALGRKTTPRTRGETRILDSQTRFDSAKDPITQAIVRLVQAAKREILVQSPYLVLSEEGVSLLEAAGRRGVKMTIITNSPVSSDNALSQAFFLEQWPEILARVPNLRLYVGGKKHTLHSKTAVFDGQLALVGTYNLDPTSMALNSEVVAAVWKKAFSRQVAEHPRKVIAAGAPGVYEYTIARDESGKPIRGEDGKPKIAFGPEQHCTAAEWKKLGAYWALLRAAEKLPGFSPIL